MDIVLGVSMEHSEVHLVLVEGENADGATVDQDVLPVVGQGDDDATTPVSAAPDQVTAAILGTRESALEGGYHLASTGVTCSDQAQAAVLRDALAERKVENVMLVSAFLAAAALAQAVGTATGYARTGLLFIEPDTAAFVVVDSTDGSITPVRRCQLSGDVDTAATELATLVAGEDAGGSGPDGLFVVGSGVDPAAIKPALEMAASLPVSVPEQPELALARGAALASAHAPLFASSTRALAWAQDPGTDEADADLLIAGYVSGPVEISVAPVDYEATEWQGVLAYSALDDETDSVYLPAPDEIPQRARKPFLVAGSALIGLFILGVVALVVAVVITARPPADVQPDSGHNIVVPTQQVAVPPPVVKPPAPPPPSAIPGSPAPPAQTIPKRAPVTHQPPAAVPAPTRVALPPAPPAAPPAPPAPPVAPAPVIVVPAPVPVPVAPVPAPAPAAPPPVAPRPLFPGLQAPRQQVPPQQRWFPGGGQTRGGFHPFHPFHPFRPPERHRGLFGR